jgi:hypothetical protein
LSQTASPTGKGTGGRLVEEMLWQIDEGVYS